MRWLRVVVLVGLIMWLTAVPAAAADIRQGQSVVIGTTEAVEDDLYAFAGTIAINGTVHGDVLAVGNNISVDGTVDGDLIASGATISIRGQIGGSVRVAGSTVFVDGKVNNDLFAAGNDITVNANGRVGRDGILAANTVRVGGQIGRHVQDASRELTIDGPVGGDVRAQVETLRLTARAAVDGSLTYTSANEAILTSGAVVRGSTSRELPPAGTAQPFTGVGAVALDWLRGFVGLLLLGLFLVLFFPGFSRRAGETVVRTPLVSLGIGVAVCVGVPIVAVLIFALGAVIGGWWLGLVALAFYFAALAVSIPVAALGVGASILRVTRRPAHLAVALVLGLAVLLLIGLVPIMGAVVLALALLFGLGATTMAVAGGRQAEPAAA